MISKNYIYAVVGASNNETKYGHKVLKDLKEAGYKVIPINLKEEYILGLDVYPTLEAYPSHIDVVIFVVPPQVCEKLLKEVKKLGISNVWFQPGSESAAAIKFCEQNGITYVTNSCIMITRKANL